MNEVDQESEEDLSLEGGRSQWSNSCEFVANLDDEELKEEVKRRYLPYLTSLNQDNLKKKKKGKLPKEATEALLNWWLSHISWPYPSVMNDWFRCSTVYTSSLNYSITLEFSGSRKS